MEITQNGRYKVIKDGIQISRHNNEREAYESAINNKAETILYPDKITLSFEDIEVILPPHNNNEEPNTLTITNIN